VDITRRDFLKISGAATGFLIASPLFGVVKPPKAYADVGPKVGTESTSICCYCACGCGIIITADAIGRLVNVEGDPEHPVNWGTLCSKGQALFQVTNQRLSKTVLKNKWPAGRFTKKWPKGMRAARVLWRRKNSTRWKVVKWGFALKRIAKLFVDAYVADFETNANDSVPMTVNRLRSVCALGGAAHDNEECYLMRKLWTSLGLVYVDHQARI